MLILARLHNWLFEGGGQDSLPERVRLTIRRQQDRSEILIGWAELVLVALLATALFGEKMDIYRWAGTAIIMLGVVVLSFSDSIG